jgi:lipoprotein-releasing system ATP-binding protein
MNNDPILTLKDVEKTYVSRAEKLTVLKGINLEINEGEIVVITGESGCGKSTLLNLIGGLDYLCSGHVISAGYKVSHLGEEELTKYRNKVIGFIFQFHYLLKDFSAVENVMLPAFMGGVEREEAMKKSRDLLEQINMGERASHYPSQLSGGERQRVAVARSLINDPHIILADEPTGNLDEKNSRTVEDLLFSLVRKFRKTLILVTHDTIIREKVDRFYKLEGGNLQLV